MSVRLGAGLIVAAVVGNAIDMTRWVARQKRRLAVAVAEALPPPTTSAAGRYAALSR